MKRKLKKDNYYKEEVYECAERPFAFAAFKREYAIEFQANPSFEKSYYDWINEGTLGENTYEIILDENFNIGK